MSGQHRMSLYERWREFAVGLFFILGMAILATITIVLKKDTLFQDRYPRQILFDNISSLSIGDKAVLRGLEVGRVGALAPVKDGQQIMVTLDLTYELEFHEGYLVEIRTVSALGGKQVYLELGDKAAPAIPGNAILQGTVTGDLMNETAKLAKRIGDAVDSLMEVVDQVKTGDGTVHKLLYEDKMYTDLQASFKSLEEAGKKVGDAMDTLKSAGATIDEKIAGFDKLKEDMLVATESIRKAGVSLENAGDSVRASSEEIKGAITDARAGKGTVGKLLTDEALYNEAKETLADIRSSVKNVTSGSSSLGKVMNDSGELYDSIKGGFDRMGATMDNANEIVAKIKRGEGTIGRLVNDEALYQEAQEAVKEVRGAVNDFREQSPILTFGSFVFGAL